MRWKNETETMPELRQQQSVHLAHMHGTATVVVLRRMRGLPLVRENEAFSPPSDKIVEQGGGKI